MPYVPIPWASHAPPCWLRLVPHRRHAASTRSAHGSQFARKRILIGGTGQCDGAFHLRDGRFEVTRCYRIQLCDGPVHTSRRHPITVRLVNADGVLVLLDALGDIPLGNVHITERDKKAGLVRIVATFPDPREDLVFIVVEGCDQELRSDCYTGALGSSSTNCTQPGQPPNASSSRFASVSSTACS